MTTLTIDDCSLFYSPVGAKRAKEIGSEWVPWFRFLSARALMRTLGGERFDLNLAWAGTVNIREAARRLDRDVKVVRVDFLLKVA